MARSSYINENVTSDILLALKARCRNVLYRDKKFKNVSG
jgi:hypothetical protein